MNTAAITIVFSHKIEMDMINKIDRVCLMRSPTEEGTEAKGLLSMCNEIYDRAKNKTE
jgi:hypothetical protein